MEETSKEVPSKEEVSVTDSLASTPALEMLAQEAIEAFNIYVAAARLHMTFPSLMVAGNLDFEAHKLMHGAVLLAGSYLFSCAMKMPLLDSEIMDLTEEDITNSGYGKVLVGISPDTYENDDECEKTTRFSKKAIRSILCALPLGPIKRVYYHGPKYYKFVPEELLFCTLRRMATGRTHKDLVDSGFGGCSRRWRCGCTHLVGVMDVHFYPLVGPGAI